MKNIVLALALSLVSQSALARVCAVLKEHQTYDSQSLVIHSGDVQRSLENERRFDGRSWNNAISRAVVFPGCTLVAYQYDNLNRDWSTGERLNGYRLKLNQYIQAHRPRVEVLYGVYNDTISSLRCECQ